MTRNKTLMHFIVEHELKMNRNRNKLEQINYVYLKKGILLLYEVVGVKGKMQTSCYWSIEEESLIKWSFGKIVEAIIT